MTLNKLFSGKVRDIYSVDDDRLLMVTSDRISAFDVVMEEPIPNKGKVLTQLSAFWFDQCADLAPSHMISIDPSDFPSDAREMNDIGGRAMLVRKADMVPVECIVRGYLAGSAWEEYQRTGTMHGTKLPDGMQKASRLPEPVFTPSTKGELGEHDVNLSFEEACDIVGDEVAKSIRELSIALYQRGADWAAKRGIIVADTKFELGFIDGKLSICDELLTPDSSRFWPADQWTPGKTPPSFDKQPLRDWLETTGWGKTPPPPALPADVVRETSERYVASYRLLTDRELS